LLRPLRAQCRTNAVERPRLRGVRCRKEGLAAVVAGLGRLLLVPGERYILDPRLAGVIHQRERQSVFVGSAELINTGPLAAFRGRRCPAGLLNCDGIACDCIGAPDFSPRLITDDVKCAVGFDGPDSTERVSPCAGQRGWAGSRSRGTGTDKGDQGTCGNYAEIGLCFHAVHRVSCVG
jgi:hypothetical protein